MATVLVNGVTAEVGFGAGTLPVCTTYRELTCHGNDERLVEATLGGQHPSHLHESDTFEDAGQFVPEHSPVGETLC
jgi:hypothetical protein